MANSIQRRLLKAFMRLDGQGRSIAGSLVYRKNKPKNGKWVQVQAFECCDLTFPTTTTTTTAA
jgi:hypothetical protein